MTDKADLARDYGVTEEQLQLKCSEDAILEIGEFISWREVGQRLPGVGRDGVRDGNKEGYNEAEKRTKVMEKWEERRGKSATYDEMITAMLKARKRKEAEKVFELLKREHGSAVKPTPVPAVRVPVESSTVKPKQKLGPTQTLLDSPGLAVIVNCDYEECGELDTLLGTKVDADEMKMTCEALNYVIKQLVNPTKEELQGLLQEVSRTLSTCGEIKREVAKEKVIIFAFSGHGTSKGTAEKLYANDGQMLDFKDEIIKPFTDPKGIFHVPKLFLIDACRGTMRLIAKGGGGGASGGDEVVEKADEEVYFEKGVQHKLGNYRIDYSTIPHHVSYATSRHGSMWMPKLARALRTHNDSYGNIADNVKEEVHLQLSNKDMKQMCQSVDCITVGTIYLQERPY